MFLIDIIQLLDNSINECFHVFQAYQMLSYHVSLLKTNFLVIHTKLLSTVKNYLFFICWSNLYIFQTSIASISSSFVDEGVVLWFNSKCISRLTLSFVLQSQSGHQYAYGLLNLLDVFPAIVDNKLSRCWLDLCFIHFQMQVNRFLVK